MTPLVLALHDGYQMPVPFALTRAATCVPPAAEAKYLPPEVPLTAADLPPEELFEREVSACETRPLAVEVG